MDLCEVAEENREIAENDMQVFTLRRPLKVDRYSN